MEPVIIVKKVGFTRIIAVGLALIIACLWVFYHYFVMPVYHTIDKITPWQGLLPFVPISCTTAPKPEDNEVLGWAGLFHDIGAAGAAITKGPPSVSTMESWYRVAGASTAQAVGYMKDGAHGRVISIPNAPVTPKADRLTDQQVAVAAHQAGWPDEQIATVVARVRVESSGVVAARDYHDGSHWGLLQLGPAERAKYLDPGASADDPVANLQAGLRLWTDRGWQPWSASDAALRPVVVHPVASCTPSTESTGAVSSNGTVEAAVQFALAQRGKRYEWGAAPMEPGGKVPSTYDCSSLVDSAYMAAGVEFPGRATTYQLVTFGTAEHVAERGDLVFPDAGHVGIALGDGTYVHAPHTGDVVKVSTMPARPWAIRRIIDATASAA